MGRHPERSVLPRDQSLSGSQSAPGRRRYQGLLALLALFALALARRWSQPIDKAPTAAGFGAILALVLFYFAQSQGMSLCSLCR